MGAYRDGARRGDPRPRDLRARGDGGHLERIEAVNPRVNAIVTLLDPELALQAAAEADAEPPRGVLHGLPIAVKDLEDTAGMRTTYGSPLFADHVPEHDSLLVERLRAAGAIVIGKTNTPEFGAGSQTFNEVFGATRNPYDLTKTPGGSSGGAAAAVAAGMLPFADGSDLGASVRNPAAFCNLVGLRPSPGRIPTAGPGDPWNPFPVLGTIARTPRDVALLLHALAGPDPRDPLSIHELVAPETSTATRAACGSPGAATSAACRSSPRSPRCSSSAARRSTDLGCIVEDAEPDFSGADECFEVLRGVGFAGAFADIVDHVKPTLRREHPLRPVGSTRRGSPARSPCAASSSRACASSSPATTCSPRRSRRSRRSPSRPSTRREIAGVRDGLLPRVVSLLQPDHGHRAPGDRRPRRASRPAGCPIGLQLVGRHRGELELLRLAHAFPGDAPHHPL